MASAQVSLDWQMNKSLVERNRIMLERQLHTDVTFVFEDKQNADNKTQVLRAHQYMLISSSPVFCSMLTGGLATGGDILIEDVEYDAFTALLRYIYCEELHLTGDSVMQILYASKKYMIPSVTSQCSHFLEENINPQNVCTILEQAMIFDEKDLIEKCQFVVREDTAEVFESESFKTLSHTALDKLLQLAELSIEEIDVFKACIAWARYKEPIPGALSGQDIRQKLGDLLYRIRFPVMSGEEFTSAVSPLGVLSQVEELACFRFICGSQVKDNLPFISDKRKMTQKPLYCGVLHRPNMCHVECYHADELHATVNLNIQYNVNVYVKPEVMKLAGFRILCNAGCTLSAVLLPIAQPRRRKQQHSFNAFLNAQQDETQFSINKAVITSVNNEGSGSFADVYFPRGKLADLHQGQSYCLNIIITNMVNNQWPFIMGDHLQYRYGNHDLIIRTEELKPAGKSFLLGIFVVPAADPSSVG